MYKKDVQVSYPEKGGRHYMTLQAVYKSQHDLRCRAESYIQLRNTFSCVRGREIKQNISEAFANGALKRTRCDHNCRAGQDYRT